MTEKAKKNADSDIIPVEPVKYKLGDETHPWTAVHSKHFVSTAELIDLRGLNSGLVYPVQLDEYCDFILSRETHQDANDAGNFTLRVENHNNSWGSTAPFHNITYSSSFPGPAYVQQILGDPYTRSLFIWLRGGYTYYLYRKVMDYIRTPKVITTSTTGFYTVAPMTATGSIPNGSWFCANIPHINSGTAGMNAGSNEFAPTIPNVMHLGTPTNPFKILYAQDINISNFPIEEGLWTPVSGQNGVTVTSSIARYFRIKNLCYLHFRGTYARTGSPAAVNMPIHGAPFVPKQSTTLGTAHVDSVSVANLSFPPAVFIDAGGIYLSKGIGSFVQTTDFPTIPTEVLFNGVYEIM